MKIGLFTGCVAKGAGRELLTATMFVAEKLGIELVDLTAASCCGAGVVHEDNPHLADALNLRTFSLAEGLGLDTIITICSTCQGVMSSVMEKTTADPKYLERLNRELKIDTGNVYNGTVQVKHFYQLIEDDFGVDNLEPKIKRKLTGLNFAPYYGCWITRPHVLHGVETKKATPTAIENTINIVGGNIVEWPESEKCCGFPVLMPSKSNSLHLAGNVVDGAKKNGADCIVTACPLCHLNLDSYQSEIESMFDMDLGLPILHYPQMLALALGATPEELKLDSHIVQAGELFEVATS